MTRADREQARRIEAYVDEIVERRRFHGDHERRTADDEELAGLRGVVDALAELEVAPPAGFRSDVTLRWLWGDMKRLLFSAAGPPAGFRGPYPRLWQG